MFIETLWRLVVAGGGHTFGWPAKGASPEAMKMRTLAVLAGSFGGRTNVTSLYSNWEQVQQQER